MYKFIILFENAISGRVYGSVRFTSTDPEEYYKVDDGFVPQVYPMSNLYDWNPVYIPGEL